MADHFDLDGRKCWIYTAGEFADAGEKLVLFFPANGDMSAMLPDIMHSLGESVAGGRCKPFVLAGFESDNWEADFTPWPAPRLFKRSADFAGNARQTLGWVEGTLITAVLERCGLDSEKMRQNPVELGIAGYSLGGLFALWALCESGRFTRCASCSGSLWFDGWVDYMRAHRPPDGSRIYLSLGQAEERARNQRMAGVGDITRQAAGWYGQSPSVAETTLAWHAGGHFDDVPGRLRQALAWLAKA